MSLLTNSKDLTSYPHQPLWVKALDTPLPRCSPFPITISFPVSTSFHPSLRLLSLHVVSRSAQTKAWALALETPGLSPGSATYCLTLFNHPEPCLESFPHGAVESNRKSVLRAEHPTGTRESWAGSVARSTAPSGQPPTSPPDKVLSCTPPCLFPYVYGSTDISLHARHCSRHWGYNLNKTDRSLYPVELIF